MSMLQSLIDSIKDLDAHEAATKVVPQYPIQPYIEMLNDDLIFRIIETVADVLHPAYLVRLSVANKRFRELAASLLFRRISIPTLGHFGMHVLHNVCCYPRMSLNLKRIEALQLDLTGPKQFKMAENDLTTLTNIIAWLPRVETLSLSANTEDASYLRKKIGETGLRLDKIRYLTISPTLHFLIPLCPRIKAIVASKHDDFNREDLEELITAASAARLLVHLELYAYRNNWQVPLILEKCTNIWSLALGDLTPDFITNSFSREHRVGFEALDILRLADLPTLLSLAMSKSAFSAIGAYEFKIVPLPYCEDVDIDMTIAKCFFVAMPNIYRIWTGNAVCYERRDADFEDPLVVRHWVKREEYGGMYGGPWSVDLEDAEDCEWC